MKSTPGPQPSAPSIQPAFEISTNRSPVHTQDIEVPLGARVPAILMDEGSPDDSAETQNIMAGIIAEFSERIQKAKQTNRNMEEAWEEAREAADERYRQFFGFEAFNAATLESTGEAEAEANSVPMPAVR